MVFDDHCPPPPRTRRDAGDLLSMLLATRDEETGRGLTDRELRDQVLTFIGAGHETTAVALAWTVYLLEPAPRGREPAPSRGRRGPRRPDAWPATCHGWRIPAG